VTTLFTPPQHTSASTGRTPYTSPSDSSVPTHPAALATTPTPVTEAGPETLTLSSPETLPLTNLETEPSPVPSQEEGIACCPSLVPGVQLLGEYEGSGYVQPHYLARRPDEQVVQITRLLHLVASAIDGQRDLTAIAGEVTRNLGRPVSPGNIEYLIERKLQPLGLVNFSQDAGVHQPICGHRPVLSLAARRPLFSAKVVNRVARVLRFLFVPFIVTEVLNALALADWWLLTHVNVTMVTEQVTKHPSALFAVLALTLASMIFHEFGHASACRYGGGTPGHIGAGIYIIWPALYTNVTDAYRLGRVGRLRTDLGGIYFNVIFILATVGAYLLTGWEPLVLVVFLGHMEIFQQLLPIVRLDGYFILGDAVGVPDLFAYMKPIMKGLVPGRSTGAKAMALTRRARLIVRCWVIITATLIAANLVSFAIHLPTITRALVISLRHQVAVVVRAAEVFDLVGVVAGVISLIALILPTLGMAIVLARLIRQLLDPLLVFLPARQRLFARHLVR
jgi:putative peptide zinc metalloprotease protein